MSAPSQEYFIPNTDLTYPAFQHHFSSPLVVVFTLDIKGRFISISNASSTVWGYNPEELLGTSSFDIIVTQNHARTQRYLDELIKGRQVPVFENYFRKKDGNAIPISWRGRWDEKDERFYFVAYDITERKVIQEQKEQYLKDITEVLERINDGFFSVDTGWAITYWNNKAESILGKSKEEVLGRNMWECYPEAIGSFAYHQYHKAFEEQVPVHFEFYLNTHDQWFNISAYPSGNGLSAFFTDITASKQAESELRNLSLIAKQTINVVLITSPDGNITWVNDAFTRISGYSFEEAIGKKPYMFFVGPETDPDSVSYIHEQLAKEKGLLVELISYTRKGEQYWSELQGQPLYGENGELQQYFFMSTDITERKRTEEELRKLSLLAKETENIVIICDMEGRISWVNDALTRKAGYTPEEAIGKYPPQLFHGPETDPKTVQYISECIGKGETCRVEIQDYTKSKEMFWSELSLQPVKDAKGKVYQYFAIQTNITERKRLQEKLESEQKTRQKGITAATIKAQENERAQVSRELHDNVNQVLTTVKLYNELCRDGIGETKELMDKSIKYIQDSINEIRSLSKRLSAPSLGDLSISASMKELISSISLTNKVSINIDTANIDHLAVSEELHLAVYRILQEHMTNIIRHAEAKNVLVLFDEENGQLTLQVTDDGKGFDVDQKRGGIGITNMITRAESLNGTLTVSSALGQGCILVARLPVTSN